MSEATDVTAMTAEARADAWAPLRRPLFRDRWIASLVSNTGGWMQDTAATWLMTALTSSPLLIALMQTAASLPVLLLGLLAGAMADILDRRKLLLFWQTWMLAAAVMLSVLCFFGGMGPWTLLLLTLLLNVGAAMNNPAWQAIVPELVPRSELAEAISLNSAAYNLARALGPALGGLAVALFVQVVIGAGAVFFINAVSFVFVIVVLYRWNRTPLYTSELPTERVLGSIRAGLRYVHHSRPIQRILIRAFLVTSCVSAMWALLAIVAQKDLRHGAFGYGILNGCIGAGAVMGAVVLPRVRNRFSADAIITMASFIFVATLLVMAFIPQPPVLIFWLIAAGFAWTSTTSTLNISVQISVPAWVQARALGTYQMVFQAGMAIGSAAWGWVAEHAGTPNALAIAACCLVLGILAGRRLQIVSGAKIDLSSARKLGLTHADPLIAIELKPEAGPVLISIDYLIDPPTEGAFIAAIDKLRTVRLRDGAMRWSLYKDAAVSGRYVETFLVESWAEYLRQRERFTVNDLRIRDAVTALHTGDKPPVVSRMVYTATSSGHHQRPVDS